MVRMQIYITEAQRRALERKAKTRGESVAALIRSALDRYLAGAPQEPDVDAILDQTFGAISDLEVPPRSEWDRDHAAEDAETYG
jgi:hypothetical protein